MGRPFEPDKLYEWIDAQMSDCLEKDFDVTPGLVGALIGHIEKAIKETLLTNDKNEVAEMRRKIFGFLFGKQQLSSKELVFEEVYALKEWVDAQDVGGQWLPQQYFNDEIRFLVWRLL